jgi:hypothetical protein
LPPGTGASGVFPVALRDQLRYNGRRFVPIATRDSRSEGRRGGERHRRHQRISKREGGSMP